MTQTKRKQEVATVAIEQTNHPVRDLKHQRAIAESAGDPPYISIPEQQALVLEHQEVAMRLAWRMLNKWRVRMREDEIRSITGAALCEAAYRFNPAMNVSFKTFLFYHLRGLLIKEITAVVHHQKAALLSPETALLTYGDRGSGEIGVWEGTLVDKESPEKMLQKRELKKIFEVACSHLDELELEVVKRSFIDDEALVEIAKDLKYCRCHISRVKSRAIKLLREVVLNVLEEHAQTEHDIRDNIPIHSERKLSNVRPKSYTGGRGRRQVKKKRRQS